MSSELETRRRRALYRAEHRGTKEMDLMLGRFVRSRFAVMGPGELDAIERLLSLPDPDLNAWILDPAPVAGSETGDLIIDLRRFLGLETTEGADR